MDTFEFLLCGGDSTFGGECYYSACHYHAGDEPMCTRENFGQETILHDDAEDVVTSDCDEYL